MSDFQYNDDLSPEDNDRAFDLWVDIYTAWLFGTE